MQLNTNNFFDANIQLSSNLLQSSQKVDEKNPSLTTFNEANIRKELEELETSKENIDAIIPIIKEIVDQSKILGQPINYDKQGMAYIRKNEQVPFTLQVYSNGSGRQVYIHLKSKTANKAALIGQACQKTVYKAISQSGEVVAASVIKETAHVHDPEMRLKTFNTEKESLSLFKGLPFILQQYHASSYSGKADQTEKYGLITEYCDGRVDKGFLDQLNFKDRWIFFLNILKGVKAMHDKGYCHFDLKEGNILYKKVEGNFVPRIIDFGLMHPFNEKLNTVRGACLPPETKAHENYPITVTEKIDVWSLGEFAARNLFGMSMFRDIEIKTEYLFDENNNYLGKKLKVIFYYPQVQDEMKPFLSIIQKMLDGDPNNRLSMESTIMQITEEIEKLN